MKTSIALFAVPLLATLAACGPANDITVTNDNNVVLNDLQANYAFTNDGDVPANDANTMAPVEPANGMMNDTAPANTTVAE